MPPTLRAREPQADPLQLELEGLRRSIRQLNRTVRRLGWSAAMQRRTTRIGTVVRRLMKATRGQDEVWRAKEESCWVISRSELVIMEIDISTPARTIEELERPLPVLVRRPGLVDPEVIDQLQLRGLIDVEVMKVAA